MKIIHIVDQSLHLIEVAKEGSERMTIWNTILRRTANDFNQLHTLTLLEVPEQNLIEKIQNALQEVLIVNAMYPNDYPKWKGRFQEDEVFVTKTIFSKEYKLCTSGRENTILFLANIYECLCKITTCKLFEVIGDNHKEIKRVYDQTASA
jgi:hypothetical protein